MSKYAGMELHVGLDLHGKQLQASIACAHTNLKNFSYPMDIEKFVDYLESEYGGASFRSCYEAGYFGFWVDRQLRSRGIANLVVNPSDIPSTDRDRNHKTDKLDSNKLVRGLRGGLLEGIYVPGEEQESDRSLLRHRKQVVRDISRQKARIKSFLGFFGVQLPAVYSGNTWSKTFLQWLRALTFEQESKRISLDLLMDELELLIDHRKKSEAAIRKLAEQKYQTQVSLLRSIPGIGLLSSMSLLTELGPIDRFKSNEALRSYVGLIPRMHHSGDKQRSGAMTKRGNKFIKEILIECSWIAIRKDPSMTRFFVQYTKRMPPNRAIIRIAGKMLSRIKCVLDKQIPYQLGY